MANSLAVIIRFSGDSADLLERFERARRMWIEAQDDDYERPSFYAACRTREGIAVLNVWNDALAHRAFGQGLHLHLEAAGLGRPAEIERLRVEQIGWE